MVKAIRVHDHGPPEYNATREELLERVVTDVASGVLGTLVNHSYHLSKAAQAHADLENRKTSESVVLIPVHGFGQKS